MNDTILYRDEKTIIGMSDSMEFDMEPCKVGESVMDVDLDDLELICNVLSPGIRDCLGI